MSKDPKDRFVEALGMIAQAEGMPRISGRILGHLVLADEALSLTEIAEALDISKASASTNLRLLESRGTAEREPRKGSRHDHWRVRPNPHTRVLRPMSQRFHRNAERMTEIAKEFPAGLDRNKVADFADFYTRSADFLAQWADAIETPPVPKA
ncbi:GbsR/MarR family transcriptional regulator [Oceanicola sp. 502str15]|uniref:GbsR/MarR family transcriptional regulator n=1 Tax=Oceanicola sp. 502str15 TaxID=2696061 RepID=UPI0020941628|nr:MarR family transcriptional regulator [Oceanicola sp. 502str15]MCO6382418.1 MarR family transcriptional regulator [Oceanicola sp. 502str15]